jgi:hypothetical protein
VTGRHLNFVFSDPVGGREAEFNEWYTELHVHDCLRDIAGYVAARRYRLDASAGAGQPARWSYAALYELETASLPEVFRSVEAFRARGDYVPPAGLVAPGHTTWVYSPAGAAVGEAHAPDARLCLCFTNAHNGWYDEHVLEEVAPSLDGFASGRRYVRSSAQRLGVAPPWERLCVYELAPAAVEELVARRRFAALGPDHATWVLEPISERATKPAAERARAAR